VEPDPPTVEAEPFDLEAEPLPSDWKPKMADVYRELWEVQRELKQAVHVGATKIGRLAGLQRSIVAAAIASILSEVSSAGRTRIQALDKIRIQLIDDREHAIREAEKAEAAKRAAGQAAPGLPQTPPWMTDEPPVESPTPQ
jgi:hypothetical protein